MYGTTGNQQSHCGQSPRRPSLWHCGNWNTDHRSDLPVVHGTKATQGYLFSCAGKTFGYVPDCHRMSDDVVRKAAGVDVMVLDGLRRKPHAAHLSLAESVEILQRIGAGRSFITHLCHDLDHEQTRAMLPPTFDVAYDGLAVEL